MSRFEEDLTSQKVNVSEWVPNLGYYPRNLIAVVTRNFDEDVSFGEEISTFVMASSIRAIIELHPVKIDGLHSAFVEGRRLSLRPTFVYNERYGRPIDHTHTVWHQARAARQVQRSRDGVVTKDDEVDSLAIDVMFFEVDPTHTVVVKAFWVFDMYPESSSGIESKRDITQLPYEPSPKDYRIGKSTPPSRWMRFKRAWKAFWSLEQPTTLAAAPHDLPAYKSPIPELKVTYAGKVHCGRKVEQAAQRLLDGLIATPAEPYTKQAFAAAFKQHVESAGGQSAYRGMPAIDPEVFSQLREEQDGVYRVSA